MTRIGYGRLSAREAFVAQFRSRQTKPNVVMSQRARADQNSVA